MNLIEQYDSSPLDLVHCSVLYLPHDVVGEPKEQICVISSPLHLEPLS